VATSLAEWEREDTTPVSKIPHCPQVPTASGFSAREWLRAWLNIRHGKFCVCVCVCVCTRERTPLSNLSTFDPLDALEFILHDMYLHE
jgi:hypothetical protein